MKFRLIRFPIFGLVALCQASTKTFHVVAPGTFEGWGCGQPGDTWSHTPYFRESICLWTFPRVALFLSTPFLASQNANVPHSLLPALLSPRELCPMSTPLSPGSPIRSRHVRLSRAQLLVGSPGGSAGHTVLIWGYFDYVNIHVFLAISSQINWRWWNYFPEWIPWVNFSFKSVKFFWSTS